MAHVSFPDLKEEMEENPPQHVQVPALGDLSSLKVLDVIQSQVVLSCAEDTPLSAALQSKFDKYYSVPVMSSSGDLEGLCGLLDVLEFIVRQVQHDLKLSSPDQISSLTDGQVEDFCKNNLPAALQTPVKQVQNLSKAYEFKPEGKDLSLEQAMRNLTSKNCRRVVIVEDKKVVSVISTSNILKVFAKQSASLESLKEVIVKDSGLVSTPLYSLPCTTRILDAFIYMWQNKVSAVAVTDETGHIYSVTALKDLHIALTRDGGLLGTLEQLIALVHKHDITAKFPVVSCCHNDNLAHVVERVAATGLHRLIVKNDAGDYIGVLAIRDILKGLVDNLFA